MKRKALNSADWPDNAAIVIGMVMAGLAKSQAIETTKFAQEELSFYSYQLEDLGLIGHFLKSIVDHWVSRKILFFGINFLIPGLTDHIYGRKAFIRNQASAIRKTYPSINLLILGCGFDCLGIYSAIHYPTCQVVEMDLGPRINRKSKVYFRQKKYPSNWQGISIDLQENATKLPELSERTLVILEGVAMYLSYETFLEILTWFKAAPAGCYMIFGFMAISNNGLPGFAQNRIWTQLWLKLIKMSFSWGRKPEEIVELCQNFGLTVLSSWDSDNKSNKSVIGPSKGGEKYLCIKNN